MKLKLTGDDCALIFKADGSREALINTISRGERVLDHVVLMSAILCRLKAEPAFEQEMRDWIEAERAIHRASIVN